MSSARWKTPSGAATVNDAAFSWYPKEGWLGIAMRLDKWRFVERTNPGQAPVRELYIMVPSASSSRRADSTYYMGSNIHTNFSFFEGGDKTIGMHLGLAVMPGEKLLTA